MRRIKRIAAFVLAAVLVQLLPLTAFAQDQVIDTTVKLATATEGIEEADAAYEMKVDSNSWNGWPQGPQTYGEAGIVMDAKSGAILYAKNIDGKAYPASITKILTMLVAMKNSKLTDTVTVSEDAVNSVPYSYAQIGLVPDEQISMEDALYAVMMASANEASYAVGESVGIKAGGDYNTFLKMMNDEAKSLGAVNSHFNNTNGIEDTNHYTTARDMALITQELLNKFPFFQEVSQTLEYHIEPTNESEEPRWFQQVHKMFYWQNQHYYEYAIAGKTGYTTDARNTLVTCADNGTRTLICVVMKEFHDTYPDTRALLDYGFEHFTNIDVASNEKSEDFTEIDQSAYLVVPNGVTYADLTKEITPNTDGSAVVTYLYNGHSVGNVKVRLSKQYMDANEIKVERSVEIKKDDNGNAKTGAEEAVPLWRRYFKYLVLVGAAALLLIGIAVGAALSHNKKVKRRKLLEEERMRQIAIRKRRTLEQRRRESEMMRDAQQRAEVRATQRRKERLRRQEEDRRRRRDD